jgi:transposase InsO family protein
MAPWRKVEHIFRMEDETDGKEEAYSGRDCCEASASRCADGTRPTGGRRGSSDRRDGSKLRDELLNGEIFYTLKEAKIVIEHWRRHYNTVRPHSSLGYRPPAPEALVWPATKEIVKMQSLN